VIRDVVSQQTVQSLDMLSRMLGTVVGAWSPDSRYYAYGSSSRSSTSGLWILDVTTGDNRLLADFDATNPSWSHDGRFIAADERGKDKIVILDVSSIYRENGIGNAPQIGQ
jgi:Tol biopolymer transport system component